MAINYAALKAEILTDPTGRGYAAAYNAGADNAVADLLNTIVAGNLVFRNDVRSEEIWEAIDATDFNSLTALALQRLGLILSQAGTRGQLDVRGTNLRAMLSGIFLPGSSTRASLVAISRRDGSRGETLFGYGAHISTDDVSRARSA